MKTVMSLFVLAALAGAASPAVAAQPRQTGTLRIVVRDPSGAVIPNATVVLKGSEPATQDRVLLAVRSDGQGVATAIDVPFGRDAVSVAFPGFESRTLTDVRAPAADNRR